MHLLRLAPLIVLLALGVPQARAELSLFGTTATESRNLQPFPKWTDMLRRHIEERGKAPGSCEESRFNQCHYARWMALVDSLRGLPLGEQLDRVNSDMNKHRYILDIVNWGVKDYWATPLQFLHKEGDCEDYAIAKFVTLKLAGVDPARMRIVVLQDLNLKIAHAVLAVYEESRIRILDNQIRQVIDSESIRHYQPMYSINETSWWMHRAASRPQQPATRRGGLPPAPTPTPLGEERGLRLSPSSERAP